MIELAGTIATLIAIAGCYLSNHKDRRCYWLWLFSNSLTLAIHADAGIWSLAIRDLAFLALAVHGLRKWTRC